MLEHERLRQLRLNTLDRLSAALLAAGSLPLAMDAAHLSIAAEPLCESAHQALIAAQLAAGGSGPPGVAPSALLCGLARPNHRR